MIVRGTGEVKGNLNAPRVSLEGGCRFKGAIDMGTPVEPAAAKAPAKVADIAGSGTPRKPGSGETTPAREKQAL